jgi:hypothetical protein
MTDFQVMIVGTPNQVVPTKGGKFDVEKQSGGGDKVVKGIDALAGVWDQVIDKLTDLAVKSDPKDKSSGYELSSIEFHIGIEAGLNIGLVTKGDASVAITFSKKGAKKD